MSALDCLLAGVSMTTLRGSAYAGVPVFCSLRGSASVLFAPWAKM